MKPAPFVYHRPDTIDEVVALLSEHGDEAKVLAGGQSLVPLLALRLASPAHLVDIGGIAELDRLSCDGMLRIGAGVTQRDAERSLHVRDWCPLLADALPRIAHPQIRNRGTVCGSLAHADPAAELPAVVLALDAELVLRGAEGRRVVPARDFFVSYLETVVGPDEVLERVDVPAWPAGAGWSFHEISRRHGDFALVGAAAIVRVGADGAIDEARISFTGVAATPVRITEAEQLLVGQRPSAEAFTAMASLISATLEPPDDIHATADYRRRVAGVLAQRALADAADRCRP